MVSVFFLWKTGEKLNVQKEGWMAVNDELVSATLEFPNWQVAPNYPLGWLFVMIARMGMCTSVRYVRPFVEVGFFGQSANY